MSNTFAHLGLPDKLVRTLAKSGIVEPFPVQAATIPDVLAGKDVSGKAPTGSGKTLAFGLPLVTRVGKAGRNRPRALILAPTRELAEQIKQELAPLAKSVGRYVFAIYGGVGYGPQKGALRKGVDVLVATPGRLEDLIEQRAVDLREANIVVVDEADRMADMGFLPAVRRILDLTSRRRQTLLYSATLDGDIAVLSRDYQHDPVRHDAGTVKSEEIDATHHFWLVQHHDRIQRAADVIGASGRSIVFTRTRHGADRLAKQLAKIGIGAVAMHGGRSQHQRARALQSFSSGRVQALIATDVAARGIHIDAVPSVIHFDPPADAKDYLHRSGRTARAGASGTIVSLVTPEQRRTVRRMQENLKLQVPIGEPRLDALEFEAPRNGKPVRDRPRREAPAGREARSGKQAPNGRPVPRPEREAPNGRAAARSEQQTPPATDEGESVYIANLPWEATAEDIGELFSNYGEVHQTTIIIDRRTGRSKGFGFVDMPRPAARSAIEALHGSMLDGRDITVRFAQPRRYHD